MKVGLNDKEGRVLHGLIEEASDDVVIRLDQNGFIVHASDTVSELSKKLSGMLVMPHIGDLADPDHAEGLIDFVRRVFAGERPTRWCEFPARLCDCSPEECSTDCHRWYALSLKRIDNDDGDVCGAIGLLRSIHHKRSLEGELHTRAVTDPLTGLANRHAFCASLRRHLATGSGRFISVFAVDRMQALFMQYGQRTADEIIWGFAKFLETMALPGFELAQLDNERFAVILPEMSHSAAREWTEDVLATFSALALPSSSRAPRLTASAGMAEIEYTVDWTLRQAEIALIIARAGGGMQVSQCDYQAKLGTKAAAG